MIAFVRNLSAPLLVLFGGFACADSFPPVEKLRIEGTALVWDEVVDAGGYNVYYEGGGPSKYGNVPEYLTTIKGATSFSDMDVGVYKVIAFSQDATLFSDWDSASLLFLRPGGSFDTQDFPDTTVTFYGPDNERYLVETECSNETGLCDASCKAEGNTGVATGGFCRASTAHINASGTPAQYQCYTPEIADVMSAGVYCTN